MALNLYASEYRVLMYKMQAANERSDTDRRHVLLKEFDSLLAKIAQMFGPTTNIFVEILD
jgi:hypothetical protein